MLFNPNEYLQGIRAKYDWTEEQLDTVLLSSEGRRFLTKHDPKLFAWIYLSPHLKQKDGPYVGHVSFNEFHEEAFKSAELIPYRSTEMRGFRDAWIAPRGCGKSTIWFLLIPLWALAHGHLRFIAAYANTASQAEKHLSNLKAELENNALLRQDFPELCKPKTKKNGNTVADTQSLYQAASGAIFSAKGLDSSTLGLKIEDRRPDWLLFDDIEPDASNYSDYQAGKRLATVLEAIFPMNLYAVVTIVGTVTMAGSITDQLRRSLLPGETAEWVSTEKIRTHHFKALVTLGSGERVSFWEELWSTEELLAIAHTRSFAMNYQNEPVASDGAYWSPGDITYGSMDVYGNTILWIDPATTTKQSSDYTAVAVVSRSSGNKDSDPIYVQHVEQFKLTGEDLRRKILAIISVYPEIGVIYVESNQGGDHWSAILHDMPIKVKTHHSSESKDVRLQQALSFYQKVPSQVIHVSRFPELEDQMLGYPKVVHDDLVDAVASAVRYFLWKPKSSTKTSSSQRTSAYI